ncbi:unnamed protein product [Caenorhabditis auriculariae]|uniref:Sialin n=1 Tax=Caenorhabditis auriculariae TaxID=2777116 RepID=A0A8S1HUY6_9PELO|nr:unnamed protein product [Caenorhabditis auriculariae]
MRKKDKDVEETTFVMNPRKSRYRRSDRQSSLEETSFIDAPSTSQAGQKISPNSFEESSMLPSTLQPGHRNSFNSFGESSSSMLPSTSQTRQERRSQASSLVETSFSLYPSPSQNDQIQPADMEETSFMDLPSCSYKRRPRPSSLFKNSRSQFFERDSQESSLEDSVSIELSSIRQRSASVQEKKVHINPEVVVKKSQSQPNPFDECVRRTSVHEASQQALTYRVPTTLMSKSSSNASRRTIFVFPIFTKIEIYEDLSVASTPSPIFFKLKYRIGIRPKTRHRRPFDDTSVYSEFSGQTGMTRTTTSASTISFLEPRWRRRLNRVHYDDSMDTSTKLVPSTRLGLAVVCFFACLLTYAMRTNMSLAIVCMVTENTTVDGSVTAIPKCVDPDASTTTKSEMIGEFDWDKKLSGFVLSAFFYGYVGSQILGGYLATHYGGKRVVLVTVLGSALLTLANPIAARTSVYALILLRAAIGFLQGATFPAVHTMWSVWGPPSELSVLTGITYAGAQIGNVIVLPLSGYLCENGFDGGWPSIFYIIGSCGLLWCISWIYFTSDRPSTHPRISAGEREYIISSVEASVGKNTGTPPATPWLSIFKSKEVWACWVGHFAGDWGAYTMLVSLPSFLKDVLGLDMGSLGVWASIPYIMYFIAINIGGVLADTIRKKELLSTLNTRRSAMLVALIGQAIFLVLAGYCKCGQKYLVVGLVTAAMAISGLQYSGFVVNYLEIAPPFSGTVMGIGNTISAVAGMASPAVTSFLTPNGTSEEWQSVLWLTAAILVFGAVFFSIFASGSCQPWAKLDAAEGHELAPLREDEKIALATA